MTAYYCICGIAIVGTLVVHPYGWNIRNIYGCLQAGGSRHAPLPDEVRP